ncbi:hypothetical protein [Nocardia sp. X0981]
MSAYIESGPYCYSSALSTAMGGAWSPSFLEVLTGSAFGFQIIGGVPYFDPAGWDPDRGVDQALALLGWESERLVFDNDVSAYAELMRLTATSPVFVGPLEMGLLLHQPGSDRPFGADHFVTVLAADADGVLMHDPQGFPYAWLPREAFLAAWAGPIEYCLGRFPLRTGFDKVADRSAAEVVHDLLPLAAAWARDLENSVALRDLAQRARAGLDRETATILGDFSLRVGARRRLDAAQELSDPTISGLLDEQARALGKAQFAVVAGERRLLGDLLERTADLHDELAEALRA